MQGKPGLINAGDECDPVLALFLANVATHSVDIKQPSERSS
jgi:hypothetical protein